MTASRPSATGRSIVLSAAGVRAEIGTVAAVLRSLTVGGIAVTEPLPAGTAPPMAAGIVLAPWPNRVRDAVWMLDGRPQQLDITEVSRSNAIHGLLRNTDYEVRAQAPDSVTLGALIPPQHGWPFLLDTWVRYELRADGLAVTHGVVNHSDRPAPYAVGAHPYFRVGAVAVERLELAVAATTYYEVDARMNPVAEHSVEGTPYDLRLGAALADLTLDTPFGGVVPGVAARLTAPDGARVELVLDDDWRYLQVFTAKDFPRPAGPGLAVALEPMTAAPDALNSGDGLRCVEPGETWEGRWIVRFVPGGTDSG
ncbi:aldose 1-epimerase family protein [Nocardia flavorosea]|uniref:Aldose 1-epimerase family protein n=1 Tax=Nocardia flavorosea TaxID=53429 RepID=A0A846YS13_9NOCA|nr:aldose 1-epimerase family protein [Nocardia flavorosea]NKY60112.1 aldose 1-epimerase family protein [Nocardia flavorosea]